MINGTLFVTVILSIALILLGLSVFVRNVQETLNRLFFAFSSSIALWLITNYLANNVNIDHQVSLIANRLLLAAGGLSIILMLVFILGLLQWRNYRVWLRLLVIINFLSWILSMTPFVINDVSFVDDKVVNKFGPLAFFYFLPLFATFLIVAGVLFIGHFRLVGIRKKQLATISRSILVVVPIVLLGNAVLPIVGYYGLVNLTPLTISILVFSMFYTIVKHRLFDVRLVVARSVVYILLLGTIVSVYSFVTFGLGSTLFANTTNSLGQQIFYVVFAMFVALTFQPLKKFFDRITNRLFYRDAYDSQVFLGGLNKVLVSTIELEPLLTESSKIIEENLKSEFCIFAIKGSTDTEERLLSNITPKIHVKDLRPLHGLLKNIDQVVVTDELEADKNLPLKNELQDNNIAILVRLVTKATQEGEGAGYILFGPKKSGNPYNSQDVKIIDIIANELVIAIQNALRFEEIEQFNLTLQQRVEDATHKLRQTNEKLKKIDETKDEFISMASHQLRTPLTSVKGYVSMVMEGDAGKINPMQLRLLDQAFISSQRMVSLIADLLNVSRLKSGKFVIEPKPTNLAELIESEMAQLQETAKGRGLELRYNKPLDFPILMVDETKIRQVVMNFADNAIYYTPSGGHIVVNLEDKGETVECTVVDDGIGVPRHEQHHLFNKFYRAGNARKARPDGTGLGLFMAQKVIIAQGGSIIFHSQEDKGSTFGFTIAKSKLPAVPAGVTPESVRAQAKTLSLN